MHESSKNIVRFLDWDVVVLVVDVSVVVLLVDVSVVELVFDVSVVVLLENKNKGHCENKYWKLIDGNSFEFLSSTQPLIEFILKKFVFIKLEFKYE